MIRIIISIFLLALIGYGGIKAYPLLAGPKLTIISPREGALASDGLVRIEGIAEHTETLSFNDAPLLINEEGRFSREFVLPQGSAILSWTAKDRFGRQTSEKRMVFIP